MAPPSASALSKTSFEVGGYTTSAPTPDTTTVRPPAAWAARKDALSHPYAPPDTTVSSHSAAMRPAMAAAASP